MLDELQAAELFLQVVRADGFTHAARTVGKSASTLSRAVADLERHLGASLLARTTRRIHLTEAGAAYARHAEALLAARRAAHDAVTELTGGTPRGLLRVSMPVAVGERLLAPHVAEFRARHPDLRLELDLSDRPVALVEGGFDLAIRVGRPADSSLKAQLLGRIPVVTVASPHYLATHGALRKPSELARHECVVHGSGPLAWTFFRGKQRVVVSVHGSVQTGSPLLAAQLARAGLGVMRTTEWLIRDELRRGDLVPVLPGWSSHHPQHGGVPVFALYGTTTAPPLKSRVFVELVRSIMATEVLPPRERRPTASREKST